MSSVYDFLGGECSPARRCRWTGSRVDVLVIVNTASKCGFTPQYQGLEALHQAHRDRGFAVLGFPCNQFGGQEPGNGGRDRGVLRQNYQCQLSDVRQDRRQWRRRPSALSVPEAAKSPAFSARRPIKWNFTKFIVDRAGRVVARHAPTTPPETLAGEIEQLLGAPRA